MRACAKCRSRYSGGALFCGIDGASIVETNEDPLIGATLDRYQIVAAIGEGGNGCVYRAVHSTLHAEFAIKVLFGDLGSDDTFVTRLGREAHAASRIRNTHVVSVIDFATTPEGLSYLVMEYVKGVALDALILNEGPLHPLRAARLAEGIASGLAAAHALGFVHRDVKPSNVLVVREGGRVLAKLLDFGIVRQRSIERSLPDRAWLVSAGGAPTQPTRLTREGKIMGTPAYMSPEQWTNADVGPSADLYSLGIVLFEMLAGERPFKADDLDELWKLHFYAEPPKLPPSHGLEGVAARLMAKSPENRPKSAQLVRDELEQIVVRLTQHQEPSFDAAKTPAAQVTPRPTLGSRSGLPVWVDGTKNEGGADAPLRARTGLLVLAGLAAVLVAGGIAYLANSSALRDGPPLRNAAEPPPPSPALAEQIDQTLRRRGLSFDDLVELDRARVERGKQALASHDTNGAADLLAFAAVAPITPEMIRKKLDRLDGPVASRARTLGREGGRLLEDKYLGLYKAVKTGLGPQEYEHLSRQVAAFESELR